MNVIKAMMPNFFSCTGNGMSMSLMEWATIRHCSFIVSLRMTIWVFIISLLVLISNGVSSCIFLEKHFFGVTWRPIMVMPHLKCIMKTIIFFTGAIRKIAFGLLKMMGFTWEIFLKTMMNLIINGNRDDDDIEMGL